MRSVYTEQMGVGGSLVLMRRSSMSDPFCAYLNSSELGQPHYFYCHHDTGKEEGRTLDELAREGARRMLVSALEEEVAAYLERHAETRDAEAGCWWSGRHRAGAGHHLWCGHPGSSAPRVNERRVNEQEARVPVWEGGVPAVLQAAWRR